MTRSIGVTVIAVLSLLGSAFMFLLGVGMTLIPLLVPIPKETQLPGSPAFFKSMMLLGALMYILPAVWGFVTAIGLFRLKEWARISTIVFSVLLALTSACMTLGALMFFIPSVMNQASDPAVMAGFRWFMTGFSFLLVSIGIWWLVFFTRPRVKQQFAVVPAGLAHSASPLAIPSTSGLPVFAASPTVPERPLSLTIIAWFMLIGSLFIPLSIFLHSPAILFTKFVTGWPATLYFLLSAALCLYIGIGLLRLKPAARAVGVAYYGFLLVNLGVFYIAPGARSRMADLMHRSQSQFAWPKVGQQPSLPFDATALLPLWAGIGLISILVPLYFLVTRKKAFEEAALSRTA